MVPRSELSWFIGLITIVCGGYNITIDNGFVNHLITGGAPPCVPSADVNIAIENMA